MFIINQNFSNYKNLLSHLSHKLKVKVKSDAFSFSKHVADGFLKNITLSNGLQCLLSNFTLNCEMQLQQDHSKKEFYTIRFDEISTTQTLTVKVDNDYAWEGKQDRASVMLTSSLFDYAFNAAEGSSIKSIYVLIPRTWFAKYLNIKCFDEVLQQYLSLKSAAYNSIPFDVEYRTLFNEVMEHTNSENRNSIVIENRVMMMTEKFLKQLYQMHHESDKIKLPHDEIKRLMEVESYLIKDLSSQPPSMSFLSRVAAMSATTLKNKFKKLYGINLYEYFQKSRMHRAKVLLLSRKYSIKEIGSQLGYANLSNFASAFKKEFNRLPSQLILQK